MANEQQGSHGSSATGGNPASGLQSSEEAVTPELRVALARDPERLLRPARFLVIVSVTIMVANLSYAIFELLSLDFSEIGFFKSRPDLALAVSDSGIIWPPRNLPEYVQTASFAIYILATILSFRWIFFSARNARALGATGLKIRPGWAVGWYFIPFANLWKPYQAMNEIWQASKEPLDWESQQPSSRVGLWWTLWLVLMIAPQFGYSSTAGGLRFPGVGLLMLIGIFYSGLSIAVSVTFLMVMDEIKRLQIEAAENRNILSVF